jgi:hypothetical protein
MALNKDPLLSHVDMWKSIYWKDCPFPIEQSWDPCQNHFAVYARAYFWTLYSTPLVCLYASNILLWLAWLCNTFWNQEVWCFSFVLLQAFCFFFLALPLLCRCSTTWVSPPDFSRLFWGISFYFCNKLHALSMPCLSHSMEYLWYWAGGIALW